MKILIIGSEGFIGSNAFRYFSHAGYEVYSADLVIKQMEKYTTINPDLSDFSKLFHQQAYDVCLNASGAANVQISFSHTLVDYTLNTTNVYMILDAIRKYNPNCKYINISSAAVYGNPQYLPIDENHPIKPLSPYGWHKYYSELICKEFYEMFNIPTISIRVFSAYGPGLRKQLFWDLYQKALNSNVIKLFGTGNETRDFIYIDDLLFAIERIIKTADFQGQVINVASGQETSIKNAVTTFLYLFGFKGKYIFTGQEKVGDPVRWQANIGKLKNLGFNIHISLEEGLKKYIEWIRE
ncbi:MAG TPA: NAD-dependent epimerase/dehydratase family protein [Bacteroidales bacterium]|nr:NAD-dependent epimerase/dehydratase family protein [Bacteroidales bacterium]HOK99682.1 NAD-dependent epimerase/dehydratase family protein [Bacteroidales bacterium]HPO65938.1 NAD-dependent epimerase/dehydratase family protein [Bacteroidales bacterium]